MDLSDDEEDEIAAVEVTVNASFVELSTVQEEGNPPELLQVQRASSQTVQEEGNLPELRPVQGAGNLPEPVQVDENPSEPRAVQDIGDPSEPRPVQGDRNPPQLALAPPSSTEEAFASITTADLLGDFRESGKRRRSDTLLPSPEDTNDHTCAICLEPWSVNGEHRCASLKCGHLFGRSCILRWIDRKGRIKDSKAKCPECNQTATRKDVRIIWAKKIIAVDSEEKELAINEAKAAKLALQEAHQTAARFQLAYNMAQAEAGKMSQECDRLRRLNAELSSRIETMERSFAMAATSRPVPSQTLRLQCTHLRDVQLSSKANAARVIAFDENFEMLLVSKSVGTGAGEFTSHGLQKFNMHDPSHTEFIPNHSKPVRDVSCCLTEPGRVATASLDKTLKVTSTTSNSVICSYELDAPGWSCVWNPCSSHYIYCGTSSSAILVFDIRQTRSFVRRLENRSITGGTPTHSLHCVPWHHSSALPTTDGSQATDEAVALLAANLSSVYVWAPGATRDCSLTCSTADLGFATGCYSLAYDDLSRQVFVSYRDGPRPTSHVVCAFDPESPLPLVQMCQFNARSAATALSRSAIFSKDDQSFAFGGDGPSGSVIAWEITRGIQPSGPCATLGSRSVPSRAVLDLKVCEVDQDDVYLATLTDTTLSIYKCGVA